jgi:hypothetical protein
MKRKLQQIANAGILFSILTFGFFSSRAVTPESTKMLYPISYIDNSGVDNPGNALKGAGDVTAVFNATDDRVTYTNFNIPALPSEFTITGIAINMFGSTSGTKQLKVELTWDGGTNYTATSNLTAFNGVVGESNLGNSLYKWERTAWTDDELSNSKFGVRLMADDGTGEVALTEIAVTVFYVVPIDFCNGSAVFADGIFSVSNSQNAVGEPDDNVAVMPRYDVLELDLTGGTGLYRPANSTVKIRWAKTDSDDEDITTVQVLRSENFSYNPVINTYTINSSDLMDQVIPLDGKARYLIFQSNSTSLSIDAVTYSCGCDNCAPTVVVQNYCGYSILKAYDYTGTLEWNTGETSQSIRVSAGGIYSVTQTVDGITSEAGSGLAEPKILPETPGPISGPANPCKGTSVTYSVSPVNGATYYQWYAPVGWNIQEGQGTSQIKVLTGPAFDIDEDAIAVHVRNDECTNPEGSYLNVISKTAPNQPGPITGPENPCEETEVVYSITPVNGATFYYWMLPEGWEMLEGYSTTQITVLIGPNSETQSVISVSAGNDCFYSESTTLNVQSKICCTLGEPDMYEDNNTLQTATLITVDDPVINANILDSKDADWFYFVTGDAGLYQINYVQGSTAETMALYNSSARKLKPTDRTGITFNLLANTTYYIKVSAKLRSPAPCYSLGVEFAGSALFASEQYDDLKVAKIAPIPDGIFRIWPNPTNNVFQLYNGTENPVKVRVMDVIGRTIEMIENVGIDETTVFGSKYKPGIYFVETFGNGIQKVYKLVKQ